MFADNAKRAIDASMQNDQCFLAFNKISGALIGIVQCDNDDFVPESEYIKYRKVQMDPQRQVWVGDYDNGSLQHVDEAQSRVYEASINNNAGSKINKEYPIHRQLNAISNAIAAMLDRSGVTDEEFNAVRDGIKQIRKINKRYKQAYRDSDQHQFIDKQAEAKELANKMEGGVRELIGPKDQA